MAKDDVLPTCDACGDPSSVWFCVERFRSVPAAAVPTATAAASAARARGGIGT